MRRTIVAVTAVMVGRPSPAQAADKFEIQVYQGEHNRPWQPGLELHTNYTIVGHKQPAYEGETPPHRALRMTLEPSLGITEWLEIGGYLQGMISPYGGTQFGGWKLRAKFVVPERAELPVVLGLNVEVGRVPLRVEEDGWANEFRPILGKRFGRVGVTLNPLFGFALTGSEAFKPVFEPAGKVKVITDLGFALGAEYYTSLGRFDQGFLPLSKQEHLAFVAFDLEPPPKEKKDDDESEWELNAGIGRSLTDATPQAWVGKIILGHSF